MHNNVSRLFLGYLEQTFYGNTDSRYEPAPPSFRLPSGAGSWLTDDREVRCIARVHGNVVFNKREGLSKLFSCQSLLRGALQQISNKGPYNPMGSVLVAAAAAQDDPHTRWHILVECAIWSTIRDEPVSHLSSLGYLLLFSYIYIFSHFYSNLYH